MTPDLIALREAEARMEHGWVTVQGGTAIVDARGDSASSGSTAYSGGTASSYSSGTTSGASSGADAEQ